VIPSSCTGLKEACNGVLGTILVNTRTMYCGVNYSCRPNGLNLGAIGAHSRHAGAFDVMNTTGGLIDIGPAVPLKGS
jgi:hypothetical protein